MSILLEDSSSNSSYLFLLFYVVSFLRVVLEGRWFFTQEKVLPVHSQKTLHPFVQMYGQKRAQIHRWGFVLCLSYLIFYTPLLMLSAEVF